MHRSRCCDTKTANAYRPPTHIDRLSDDIRYGKAAVKIFQILYVQQQRESDRQLECILI